jgi:hypothetical protein
MTEQEVRDALRSLAERDPIPGDAWARIAAAIGADDRHRRQVRWGIVGGSGLVLAAAVTIAAVVLAGGSVQQVEVVPAATEPTSASIPSTTTMASTLPATTTTTATTTPSVPAGSFPANPFVVLTPDGTAALLGEDGRYFRDLAGPGVTDVAVAPGVGTGLIYYTDATGLWQVDYADAAKRTPIVVEVPPAPPDQPGGSVAISPDLKRLAYTKSGVEQSTIFIRDLGTGETREFATAPGETDFFLVLGAKLDLAWAPDNRRLAFVNRYEGEELYVLDTLSHQTLSDAVRLGELNYSSPAWLDNNRIAALGQCCYPEFVDVKPRVDVIDAISGKALTEDVWPNYDVVALDRLNRPGSAFVTSDQRAYTIYDGQREPQPFAERVVAIDG